MASEPSPESLDHVLELLAGRCRAQAASTAATLGLPDLLADGPRTAAELAEATACDPSRLERLLAFLASCGLCRTTRDGYALTDHGHALRAGALGPLAAFLGAPDQWDPWARLPETLRDGARSAFEHAHGVDLYTRLARSPEAALRYHAAIDAFTRSEARALCGAYDFSRVRTLVDVGGGHGTLLLAVLDAFPHLQGVLLDLPHVVERARARLPAAARDRVRLVPGDFLAQVPPGGDAYVLKRVLHNWDDEHCTHLLARCADAMAPQGRVLVVEDVLMPGEEADAARLLDLEMLVLTRGRERRKPDLRRIAHAAGLRLERTVALTRRARLLVAARR